MTLFAHELHHQRCFVLTSLVFDTNMSIQHLLSVITLNNNTPTIVIVTSGKIIIVIVDILIRFADCTFMNVLVNQKFAQS